MFTKKKFIVSFTVILLNLISINSYADNFTSLMKQIRTQFKAEGYSSGEVKQMTRDNTSVSNNLRNYLKSSCLVYRSFNSMPSISWGGGYMGSNEYITLNADGTALIQTTSQASVSESGINIRNNSDGRKGTLSNWNVFQGFDGQILFIMTVNGRLSKFSLITGYDIGAIGMIPLGQSKKKSYRRIANTRC